MKLTIKEFRSIVRQIIKEELDKNEEFAAEALVDNILLKIRKIYLTLPSSPQLTVADWKIGTTEAEIVSGDASQRRTRVSNRLKTYFKTTTRVGNNSYEAGEISWLMIVEEAGDNISVVLDHTPTNGQSFRVFKATYPRSALLQINQVASEIMAKAQKVIG